MLARKQTQLLRKSSFSFCRPNGVLPTPSSSPPRPAKSWQRLISHISIITAPVAGRVTKLSGAKGTYLQPGQSITMFVPQEVWVTANFKETQLDLMRAGQPVDIAVDAFPDLAFRGHVDSIQAGSGTAFSLLPAENATGNYIKVVQRIPVKIVFDQMPGVQLGPGMSVVPTVKVR
jgi:membrane fusion protein, multidrug efflux system